MMSLNIGLSSLTLQPNYNHGRPDGMSVYTRKLHEGFQNLGQEVSLWSYGKPDALATDANRTNYFGHSFAHYAALSVLSKRKAWVKPSVDVFHVTDYRAVPMSCPVVTTLYDAIPMVHPEMASPRFRRTKNFFLKNAAHCADRVIAISQYSVKELIEHYEIPREKISVVLCGVDHHWLEPIPEAEWAATLLHRGIKPGYFLFVGIIQPRKNLDRLIQAHDLLPPNLRREHPLVIVGRQGWRCEDTIARLEKKHSLGEAFWFNDVHTQMELKHFYAGAGAFVFPSLYEGFGLPILEAFAMGVTVVTSTATSLPEVSAGIGLEIDPLDVDGMAAAMQQALDPHERGGRVAAGRLRAQELSWERCALETLKVHYDLLGRAFNG